MYNIKKENILQNTGNLQEMSFPDHNFTTNPDCFPPKERTKEEDKGGAGRQEHSRHGDNLHSIGQVRCLTMYSSYVHNYLDCLVLVTLPYDSSTGYKSVVYVVEPHSH